MLIEVQYHKMAGDHTMITVKEMLRDELRRYKVDGGLTNLEVFK